MIEIYGLYIHWFELLIVIGFVATMIWLCWSLEKIGERK